MFVNKFYNLGKAQIYIKELKDCFESSTLLSTWDIIFQRSQVKIFSHTSFSDWWAYFFTLKLALMPFEMVNYVRFWYCSAYWSEIFEIENVFYTSRLRDPPIYLPCLNTNCSLGASWGPDRVIRPIFKCFFGRFLLTTCRQ